MDSHTKYIKGVLVITPQDIKEENFRAATRFVERNIRKCYETAVG